MEHSQKMEEILADMQHHDTVSGTSRTNVDSSYWKIMLKGLEDIQHYYSMAVELKINQYLNFQHCIYGQEFNLSCSFDNQT